MLYYRAECPHCGNEVTVSDTKEVQKCCWCRRLISAKFERLNKKKVRCELEPVDFPADEGFRKQSFSSWKDRDVYGRK